MHWVGFDVGKAFHVPGIAVNRARDAYPQASPRATRGTPA
jgi:hypothetical protein